MPATVWSACAIMPATTPATGSVARRVSMEAMAGVVAQLARALVHLELALLPMSTYTTATAAGPIQTHYMSPPPARRSGARVLGKLEGTRWTSGLRYDQVMCGEGSGCVWGHPKKYQPSYVTRLVRG